MPHPVAITIGNFDGVHRGHLALLDAGRRAAGSGGRLIVMSFDPHPATVLRPDRPVPPLTTFAVREMRLREAGADEVIALRPTPEVLGLTPEAFVAMIARDHAPQFLVEGPDFRFGRGRAGTIETLRELGPSHGFETIVIEPLEVALTDQQLVRASSTILRRLVAAGRVRDAAAVLGRPYELRGPVRPGARRGRDIGVPTANLDHGGVLLPADGVYAGRATRLDDAGRPTRWHAAAISVGTNPTFGDAPRICETHLVGVAGPLDDYGWTIRIQFTDWLRDQVRYDDVGRLVAQLGRDIGRAGALDAAGRAGALRGDTAGRNAVGAPAP